MKLLLAGESWTTFHTHIKGFDPFFNSTYETGAVHLLAAWRAAGLDVTYLPNHEAPVQFPQSLAELRSYDVVVLSDIGSNTLLLHPDTFAGGNPTPNRLKLLRDYVAEGGGLAMIGGYLTFAGIDGKGYWHGTPVEEVLPVEIRDRDDRVEVPESFVPTVTSSGLEHPILQGMGVWPWFLGYNRLKAKATARVLMEQNGDPFLTIGSYEQGRTAAFASDCAPHWGSQAFVTWEHYGRFWSQLVHWLAKTQQL